MAEANWTELSGSLAASVVSRGVSHGFTPPSGGGSYVFGFHALQATAGAVGLYPNQTNFAPAAKGGSIRGALQRAGGDALCTAMLAAALESSGVTANAYLLGFADDEEPGHLILRKGTIAGGLPEAGADVLRKSTATHTKGSWVHVRLDVIVQPHGDVLLQVFQNDLTVHPVTSPVWTAIDGMAEYVDDVLGINTGSIPLNGGGYFAFAWKSSQVGRRGFVDQVEVARQI